MSRPMSAGATLLRELRQAQTMNEALIDAGKAVVAERDALREALKAVLLVAEVANEGDPWYCENEGIDAESSIALARAILGGTPGAETPEEATPTERAEAS